MFLFKLRHFKYFCIDHMKKLIIIGLAVVLLAAGAIGVWMSRDTIAHRIATHRFDNITRADMIYDFEYLMTALEENWPFFNLSVSANGVDVRALADNVRVLLNDADTLDPFDFSDLLQTYFFAPINQLGHLRQTMSYDTFFQSKAHQEWEIAIGGLSRINRNLYELHKRPEVVMFYSRMRDARRGTPMPRRTPLPVMEFDIIEENRIAYMRVNRMINVWDDVASRNNPNMRHYEYLTYNFYQDIEGFEHLIIDFRGNPGGRTLHFRSFVLSQLLHEGITLHAYVHYMGGVYAALAREIFDIRELYPAAIQYRINEMRSLTPVTFAEPLPYLDTEIKFTETFPTALGNIPVNHYYGVLASARQEVLFNGKIWLLTDERTGSSAESIAAMLKCSNIATLVGAPTFGVMGTNYEATTINMSLPNTGIIVRFDVAYYTDPYGRPLQGYGIQPHYFNRPGMDALETVLAMIEER